MLDLLYVLAGAGAIVLIVGAMARDSLTMARWVAALRAGWPDGPTPDPLTGRWYLAGLVVLLALWLAAAWLR